MNNDPIEQKIDSATQNADNEEAGGDLEFIDQVETSTSWTQMRDELVNSMRSNVCILHQSQFKF